MDSENVEVEIDRYLSIIKKKNLEGEMADAVWCKVFSCNGREK